MPFSFPYYRDARQLPGPLPDQNEIERATQTLPKRSDYGGRLVVIRDKYVVKYGPLVTENEGYALLFVEETAQHRSATTLRHVPLSGHPIYRHGIRPRYFSRGSMAFAY